MLEFIIGRAGTGKTEECLRAMQQEMRREAVGIISHVEELKERIDARQEITKHREGGSQARFILG